MFFVTLFSYISSVPVVGRLITGSSFFLASAVYWLSIHVMGALRGWHQKKYLMSQIKRCRNTAFGKDHHFDQIKSIADFQRLVPLGNYDSHQAYIERAAHGERDVLYPGRPHYFMPSSGTSGKPKLIPQTKDYLRLFKYQYLQMMMTPMHHVPRQCLKNGGVGRGLVVLNLTTEGVTESGITVQCASAGALRDNPDIATELSTTPLAAYELSSDQARNYVHGLFAAKEAKLRWCFCTFSYILLSTLESIANHHTAMEADIRAGELAHFPGFDKLSDKDKAIMRSIRFQPDPKRADVIERAFVAYKNRQPGQKPWGNTLWTGIMFIHTVACGPMKTSADLIIRDHLQAPIFNSVYGASECIMGVARYFDDNNYAITPNQAFFEFIEEEDCDQEQPKTKLLHQLEMGKRYEIVLTNVCGLYRYRMGDVLEVGAAPRFDTPRMHFAYRRNMVLFIGKTTEDQLMSSSTQYQERMARLHPSSNHQLFDFCVVEIMSEGTPYYRIFLEFAHEASILAQRSVAEIEAEASAVWDELLSKVNPEYGDDRVREEVLACRCFVVKQGTFWNMRAEAVARGANPAQAKVVHVAKKDWQQAHLAHSMIDAQKGASLSIEPATMHPGAPEKKTP
ncbi:putative plant auxin-responsive GH3 [Paratrimastix pyriformis]|uniref:Plant auxin-responsive GH3 n=1 Tax=Paratrimastix pyriformis TaxID=342808 RepID=A0ABQ8UVT7_9EUKA|nr:putative plant auxin-responsive GH3 [Paratrimastix pyriformis]|eukprot:GAFH01001112.1.p1 GENE.GAFH01001112.1~~GAFH01001112.1.p1  ORF type:complete len:622 (-),score=230.37 GAFH01001112.1:48-1913(-)